MCKGLGVYGIVDVYPTFARRGGGQEERPKPVVERVQCRKLSPFGEIGLYAVKEFLYRIQSNGISKVISSMYC